MFGFSGRRQGKTAQQAAEVAGSDAHTVVCSVEFIALLTARAERAEAIAHERGAQVMQLQNQLNDSIDSRRELEKELLETIRAVRAVNFPTSVDAGDETQPPTVAEADRLEARRINSKVRPSPQPAEPS